MRSFGRLIHNEFVKLFARPTTYIMLILIPVITFGLGAVMKLALAQNASYAPSPEDQMQWRIEDLTAQIAEGTETGGDDLYIFQDQAASPAYTPQQELDILQYARTNNIDPTSWKMAALYDSLTPAAWEAAAEPGSADADKYDRLEQSLYNAIRSDDYMQYLTAWRDALNEAPEMLDADTLAQEKEELQLRIDNRLEPYYMGFFSYGEEEPWTETMLSQISSGRSQLQSGMGENGALAEAEKENLEKDIAIAIHRLETGNAPLSQASMYGFLSQASMLVSMISLFIIIIGATMMASEYSSGTIKLLLISPHKRWKLFAAKMVSLFLMGLAMLVLLFGSALLTGGILFGFEGAGPYLGYSGGQVTETPYALMAAFRYLLACPEVLVMTSLAVMLAVIMRRSAVAIGVGTALLFGGSMISMILMMLPYDFKRFILFLNTDLSMYFPQLSTGQFMNTGMETLPASGMTVQFSLAVLAVYFICFTYIALDSFNRRDIKQA